MASELIIAVTGSSGFIGRQVCGLLVNQGFKVRALVRREPETLSAGLSYLQGDLEDQDSLEKLCEGADLILHCAGLVKAVNPDDFDRINHRATATLFQIAKSHGVRKLLLISSLAASKPELSAYAASKADGEKAALAVYGEEAIIIRPPAVYGPGDAATYPIFKQLNSGFLLAPGTAQSRFSMIHVDDLSRFIVIVSKASLQGGAQSLKTYMEPDDGHKGGYSWKDLAEAASLHKKVRLIYIPKSLLRLIAVVMDCFAKLTGHIMPVSRDKLGELWHEDWVSDGISEPSFTPNISLRHGLRQTIEWYENKGWSLK